MVTVLKRRTAVIRGPVMEAFRRVNVASSERLFMMLRRNCVRTMTPAMRTEQKMSPNLRRDLTAKEEARARMLRPPTP